jgi:hypothetical protein
MENLVQRAITTSFDSIDKNHDGVITKTEWVRWATNQPASTGGTIEATGVHPVASDAGETNPLLNSSPAMPVSQLLQGYAASADQEAARRQGYAPPYHASPGMRDALKAHAKISLSNVDAARSAMELEKHIPNQPVDSSIRAQVMHRLDQAHHSCVPAPTR